jgi:mannose-1-phosphate guanylyltransferase
VRQAAEAAQYHDTLMTLGARPTYAATGYGYIKLDAPLPTPNAPSAHRVAQFTEKPNAAVAAAMIASQQYLWNCGIFIWRAATIAQAIAHHLPELWDGIRAYGESWQAGSSQETLFQQYAQLPSISIDNGVLEHATQVGVVPATFDWSDVGSWRALADLHQPDADGHVVVGKHMGQGSRGLIVYSPDKLVATVGLCDLIIVQTDDVLLICPKDQDQEVKNFVAMLQQQNQTEYL